MRIGCVEVGVARNGPVAGGDALASDALASINSTMIGQACSTNALNCAGASLKSDEPMTDELSAEADIETSAAQLAYSIHATLKAARRESLLAATPLRTAA